MASSAKFLEEALSTDVDESAVSAIVGSLENQLGTPTSIVSCQQISSTNGNRNHLPSDISNGDSAASIPNHGTANGQVDTMSLIFKSEPNTGITNNNHQQGNITQTITNNAVPGVASSSHFVNRISSNVGIVQSTNTANLAKTQDGFKTVLASNQSLVGTTSSSRVTYPVQNVNSLPNGTLNVTATPTNTALSTSLIQGMVSQTFPQSSANYHKITPVGTDPSKQPGTAVIIKSSTCNNVSTGVSSQMTTAISLSGSQLNTTVAVAKPTTASGSQAIVSNTPILSNLQNLQFVNLNAIRTPAQAGNRAPAPPRLMIPQMVRPGQQQITLQTLQGLQGLSNAQGQQFLVKTENGQYHLVRLATPAVNTSVTQNNTAATLPAGNYRVSVPVCTTAAATSTTTSTVQTVTTQSSVQAAAVQRGADNSKEKCRKFLTNLLELSSKEPRAVERNVRTLIQELIDSQVEPEEFCDRLERLLNASPQPCLIGFLRRSLPGLRSAMTARDMAIEGIRPPPAPTQSTSALVVAPSAVAQLQNNQVRPIQLGAMQQVRVALPQTTTGIRPQQQIQHRIITTPVRLQTASGSSSLAGVKVVTTPTMPTVATTVRIQTPLPTSSLTSTDSTNTSTATVQLVPSNNTVAAPVVASPTTAPIRFATPVRQTLVKTMPIKTSAVTTSTARSSPATATAKSAAGGGTKNNFISKSPMLAGIGKHSSSASQSKSSAKERERERKSAAAAASAASAAAAAAASAPVTALAGGYVGDDDVNDVAAMAGVNLAEETQRILGPSEFVGTQIRSCKDETFLHTHPLTMRILQIAAKNGLEEPSSDVVALVSHAAQERLKNILEKLNVIAEHRVDFNKADKNYEISHDIRGQLRCLEELDKVERKRHDEMERELLLRAAKSRSKSEDPEQVKLKAKAKELQRAEMEELRQREANLTALQAIGPRKKIKLEGDGNQLSSGFGSSMNTTSGASRLSLVNRPRLKRVTVRDFLYVMEKEKHINRSPFLYKSYLK